MSMLEIQHLSTDFETENGMVHAVRDVSLSVDKGEVLGIVGESGSGKSQTMFSVMGLLSGNGIVKDGSITIDGKEISPKAFSDRKEYEQVMDHIRGNDLAMIFQDPMTFLNPVLRIETQLMEPILNHMDISKEEAKKRAIELMRKVVFLLRRPEYDSIRISFPVVCGSVSSSQSRWPAIRKSLSRTSRQRRWM